MKPLNSKAPKYFQEWRNNEFWHVCIELRVNTIISGVILSIAVALIIMKALGW